MSTLTVTGREADDYLARSGRDFPEWLLESEQRACGAAIHNTAAAEALSDVVRPGWFYRPAHQIIFGAAVRLAEGGSPVDPTLVLAELQRTGETAKCGGAPYLHTCLEWGTTGAEHHARKIAGEYRRRNLYATTLSVLQLASAADFNEEVSYDRAAELMQQATLPPGLGGGARALPEITYEVLNTLDTGTTMGLPTGLADLTTLLNGLSPGELVIVAARPAIGKSVALAGIARYVAMKTAKDGQPVGVLFESLEMAAEQIVLRLLSAEARVPLQLMRSPDRVTPEYWDKLSTASTAFAGVPNLVIDYAPGCSMAHIRARMRGMQRTYPCGLLIVDYVQLMGDPPGARSRQEVVAGNVRALKDLAGEYGIPVVVAAQLNRNPEGRGDKRPQLADLRETGELEQAADVVILLHRDDANNPDSTRAGEADLIVAKHRNGPTSTLAVAFQGHYARFVDMAKGSDDFRKPAPAAAPAGSAWSQQEPVRRGPDNG